MYKEFYSLKENPFNLTPDPDFLYLSNMHKKAIAHITYGLETRKGIVQVTGEVGSGKTTILKSVMSKNINKIRSAYIVDPKVTFEQLFRMILRQFSIIELESNDSKDVLLSKFYDYLKEQLKQNYLVVVVVDEAQNIDKFALEELRMLSNLETEKEKLVQIVFVGQPELRDIFSLQRFRQLKQRISVVCHLTALNREDTEAYINHRLNVAGSNGSQLFTQCACNEIYDYSNGIPRLINIACDAALLSGYVEEKKTIDEHLVKEVISELMGNY
ncbi:MAG: ExeA family protein [Candidatus Anammoxibacter sp.]